MKLAWPLLALSLALCFLTAAVCAQDKHQVVFAEPFDGTLAKGWFWVREDPKAWRIENGTLIIKTSMGSLWMEQNNNRNILLRSYPHAKDKPVAVEVLVENEPTNGFEHAGLVWYCDDDNYVALMREKLGAKVEVQLVSETNGKPKVGFAQKPFEPNKVWLRMELTRNKAKGVYRAVDKDDWQPLGECDLPLKGGPRVGLITGYAPKTGDHEARFSNFRILQ